MNASTEHSRWSAKPSKPLVGEMDCLVDDGAGDMVIIDWKTAVKKWPEGKADRDLQATCMSYALSKMKGYGRAGQREFLFRFDVVTKTKLPSFQRLWTSQTPADFERLLWLAQVADRIVENGVFAPNETSFLCSVCQYAKACAEWHRLSARRTFIAA